MSSLDRRTFLGSLAAGSLAGMTVPGILAGCSGSSSKDALHSVSLPELLSQAPDGKPVRAGLIGCGGRGTGAAVNFLDAGKNVEIVALGDVFEDKMKACRDILKKQRNVELADEKCFIGFDAYQKVLDSGIDLVLLCTPPHFRPAHLEAAVNAGKHIFMEKPCAVDPSGIRSVLVSAKKAESQGLCILSGTIRRSQKDYMETWKRVREGLIGDITGAHIIRNEGNLWYVQRKEGWTDMEYLLRNWVNFNWLSGDHIVEQFIHEIDVMAWFLDQHPLQANAYGGRHRRVNGDQFDFFSVEYQYPNGLRSLCASRQISGCSNGKEEMIYGTKGWANANHTIYDYQGNVIWTYPYPKKEDADQSMAVPDPYLQEHIILLTAIREGRVISDAVTQANSTMTAIMGRVSAYTGKNVTWEEMMNSDLYLGPKTYIMGPVEGVTEQFPVPGIPAAGALNV